MAKNPEPRDVETVHPSYQPSKAGLEEPIDITRPDWTLPTPEELACAVLRPVSANWSHRPGQRR